MLDLVHPRWENSLHIKPAMCQYFNHPECVFQQQAEENLNCVIDEFSSVWKYPLLTYLRGVKLMLIFV